MRVRRGILRAVAMGAVTTVAVAWGLALFPPRPNCWFSVCPLREPEASHLYIRLITESVASPEARANAEWYYVYPAHASIGDPDAFRPTVEPAWRLNDETLREARAAMERAFGRPMLPWWFPTSTGAPDGVIGFLAHGSGWPFISMRSSAYIERVGEPFRLNWSVRVAERRTLPPINSTRVSPADGTLPLQPVPLGFAANTLAFAAAWWLLLHGPSDVRRWARLRRNACPACGYSREALEPATRCPECGLAGPV